MAIPPRGGMQLPDTRFDYPPDEPRASAPGDPEDEPRGAGAQPVGPILLGALTVVAIIVATLVLLS